VTGNFGIFLVITLIFTACGGEKYDKRIKPNFLLITIDTLRQDHVGSYGYPRQTSPFMDGLAKKGLRFKHAITPIPLTAGSHASILTSLHPLTHDLVMNGSMLNNKVDTMAEVLKKNGYYTIGAVAVGLLKREKNFSQGFDSFSDRWEKDPRLNPNFPLPERTAQSVNESLFKQLAAYIADPAHREKPLFIWVHYFDPHNPYYDKEYIQFKTKLAQGMPKAVNRYDKEIRYTDDCIKALYGYLEQKGLTKQLVTCITADHGEQFGEHGYTYGHADFYSETTFVPLIFHGYGIPKNTVIDTYVSTMDIGITLLGMAHLEFDSPVEGINLLNHDKPAPRTFPYPERKFLVIGNPMYARSIQLLAYPSSYILNFDYHYKYWFISGEKNASGEDSLFKPLAEEQVERRGKTLVISIPYSLDRGMNYAVLRADVKENQGLRVNFKVLPYLSTGNHKVSEHIQSLDIIYPVTVLDRLMVTLKPRPGTRLENFRYALIPASQFPQAIKAERIENRIFNDLLTLRKESHRDEWFDLARDFSMENNLIGEKKLKPAILKARKILYAFFNYYDQQKKKLLQGVNQQTQLSEEDKKMLKTLGYL
jgi:arylsulfatase A-like enzyme